MINNERTDEIAQPINDPLCGHGDLNLDLCVKLFVVVCVCKDTSGKWGQVGSWISLNSQSASWWALEICDRPYLKNNVQNGGENHPIWAPTLHLYMCMSTHKKNSHERAYTHTSYIYNNIHIYYTQKYIAFKKIKDIQNFGV